ncbi:MAG: ORF6N domain-containing protein [Nitrospiria bacterium]
MIENLSLIPTERIERSILFIRGHKVMLDADLAVLYGVSTKRLNEQVNRNLDRFPEDFMFQLTKPEFAILKSQNATSSWGGRRTLPYAFTEHGVVMLASVLNSPIAVNASLQVVRTFVRLREILSTHKDLARKLNALEKKYDSQFAVVFEAVRKLMTPSTPKRIPIGFRNKKK